MDLTSLFSRRQEWDWGLILSFNLGSFSFFESQVLGNLVVKRNLTLVIDGQNHDALMASESARPNHLGIYYNLEKARVRRGGRFHPKLYLFVSDTACSVALGSFNLSESGFKKNVEAGAIFHFELETLSTADIQFLRDLRMLLRATFIQDNGLLEPVSRNLRQMVGELIGGAFFTEVMTRAEALRNTDETCWLLSSLEQSLWTQVQERIGARVERFEVLSPFYDDGIAGLRRVADACGALHIYLPAEKSNFPKEALAEDASLQEALSLYAVSKTESHIQRRIHAKVYRLTTEDAQWALLGSANFTSAGFITDASPRNFEMNLLFPERSPGGFLGDADFSIAPVDDLASLLTEQRPDMRHGEEEDALEPAAIESAFYEEGTIFLSLNREALEGRQLGSLRAALALDRYQSDRYALTEEGEHVCFRPRLEIDGNQLIQVRLCSRDGVLETPWVFVNRREHNPNLLPVLGASAFNSCVQVGGAEGLTKAFDLARHSGREDWLWYLLTRWDLSRILAGGHDDSAEDDAEEEESQPPTLKAPTRRNKQQMRLRDNVSAILGGSYEEVRKRLADFATSIHSLPATTRLARFNEFCLPLFVEVSARFNAVLSEEERKHRARPSIRYPDYTWLNNYKKYTPFLRLAHEQLREWNTWLRAQSEVTPPDDRFVYYASVALWLRSEHTHKTLDEFCRKTWPAFSRDVVEPFPAWLAEAFEGASSARVDEMAERYQCAGVEMSLLYGERPVY
jgi:hypothetical protein